MVKHFFKVATLRMTHFTQNLCLSLNLINERNESHIKVSKYCQFVTVVPATTTPL